MLRCCIFSLKNWIFVELLHSSFPVSSRICVLVWVMWACMLWNCLNVNWRQGQMSLNSPRHCWWGEEDQNKGCSWAVGLSLAYSSSPASQWDFERVAEARCASIFHYWNVQNSIFLFMCNSPALTRAAGGQKFFLACRCMRSTTGTFLWLRSSSDVLLLASQDLPNSTNAAENTDWNAVVFAQLWAETACGTWKPGRLQARWPASLPRELDVPQATASWALHTHERQNSIKNPIHYGFWEGQECSSVVVAQICIKKKYLVNASKINELLLAGGSPVVGDLE